MTDAEDHEDDEGEADELNDLVEGEQEAREDAADEPEEKTADEPAAEPSAGVDEDLPGVAGEGADEMEDAPMADLAAEVSEADLAGADAEADLFEQKQKPEIDREALWRQVTDEETAERAVEEIDVDQEPSVQRPDRESPGSGERVVAKSSYCHSCRFFSAPPDVRCTHEGTEILEGVDMDHFRVKNCPIVAENEELEEF